MLKHFIDHVGEQCSESCQNKSNTEQTCKEQIHSSLIYKTNTPYLYHPLHLMTSLHMQVMALQPYLGPGLAALPRPEITCSR